jgi:hypothetical protein
MRPNLLDVDIRVFFEGVGRRGIEDLSCDWNTDVFNCAIKHFYFKGHYHQ